MTTIAKKRAGNKDMSLNILFGAIRTVMIAIIYKTRTFMRWSILYFSSK